MAKLTVADINQYSGSTINPLDNPDEVYELYSVPSFDSQYPEIVKGSEIGSSKITVEDGDVLVCKINPRINRVWVVKHYTDHQLLASSEWIVIRNSKMDSNYLKWYFSSPTFRSLLVSQVAGIGGSLTRAQPKQVAKYPVPIVDICEQRRIAAVLDKISGLIAKRREQLDKLDELVKARFVEMFGDPETNSKGWQRQRLDEICENLDNRRVPITSTDRKAGIYPYYGASGIVDYVDDYIFDEDILLISEDGANLVMRSTPIAFSVSGKVWVNNHAHVVRFDSQATQKYIEICFSLTDISGYITGTAQPKLNQAKLNAMMFCIPPLEMQKQFANFVAQTDKSKLTIQQSLDKLEVLKKALMQQYFG